MHIFPCVHVTNVRGSDFKNYCVCVCSIAGSPHPSSRTRTQSKKAGRAGLHCSPYLEGTACPSVEANGSPGSRETPEQGREKPVWHQRAGQQWWPRVPSGDLLLPSALSLTSWEKSVQSPTHFGSAFPLVELGSWVQSVRFAPQLLGVLRFECAYLAWGRG